METPEQETTHDRRDMTVGALGSLVVNTGYLMLVHADQRMLLMLFATVLLGMGMLVHPTKGATGMGLVIGAAASIAVSLTILAIHGSIVQQH